MWRPLRGPWARRRGRLPCRRLSRPGGAVFGRCARLRCRNTPIWRWEARDYRGRDAARLAGEIKFPAYTEWGTRKGWGLWDMGGRMFGPQVFTQQSQKDSRPGRSRNRAFMASITREHPGATNSLKEGLAETTRSAWRRAPRPECHARISSRSGFSDRRLRAERFTSWGVFVSSAWCLSTFSGARAFPTSAPCLSE